MALEWKDEYRTSVDEVDEQHRKLFAILNDLEKIVTQGIYGSPKVDNYLISLAKDTRIHFSFEENCMRRYNCPVALANKESHEQFLYRFENFQREYKAGGSNALLLKNLREMAERWAIGHICNIDIHLQSCVRKERK